MSGFVNRIRLLLFYLLLVQTGFSQVPQGIPYQAVARNGQGQPLANLPVKVRFSILDSTLTGTTVYSETHEPTTSAQGLFSVNVGMGNSTIGSFSSINWGVNAKFLKVELDTTASGNNYMDLGAQQMMSVPFALYAFKAQTFADNVSSTSSNTIRYSIINNSGIFIVPGGVYSLQIDVWGAGGGGGSNRHVYTGGGGGGGSFGRFLMNVKPNDTLNIEIGQGGQGYADGVGCCYCGCSSQGQNGGNTKLIRQGSVNPSIICGGGFGGGSPCTGGQTGPYGTCPYSGGGNAGGGSGGSFFQTGLGSGVLTLTTTVGNPGIGTSGALPICNPTGQCFGQGGNNQQNGLPGGILIQW